MSTWKLTLAYDGTAFHGWQIQPRLPTVQGTLAQAIKHLTGEIVLPQGSGRTDAGVHALAQVASFALAADIPPANLLRALNRALPPSIRVLAAQQVAPSFHARHSAVGKTYEYRIHPRRPVHTTPGPPHLASQMWPAGAGRPSPRATPHTPEPDRICPPTLAPFVWDCPWPLDLALAQQAAHAILGTHDFTSFAAVDPDENQRAQRTNPPPEPALDASLRTIHHSCFTEEPPILLYKVTGSGFLHHMVRNLVGTFIEIARGRPLSIPAILAARNRAAAGPTAPPHGLFLHSVHYPVESPAGHASVPTNS